MIDVRFEANDLRDVAPSRASTLEALIRDVVGRHTLAGPVRCQLVRDLCDPERVRVRLEGPGWQSSGGLGLGAATGVVRKAIADLVPSGESRFGPNPRLAKEWDAIGLPSAR